MQPPTSHQLVELDCFHKLGDRMEVFTYTVNDILYSIIGKVKMRMNWAANAHLFEPLSVNPNPCTILNFMVHADVNKIRREHLADLEEKDKDAYHRIGKGLLDPILFHKAK